MLLKPSSQLGLSRSGSIWLQTVEQGGVTCSSHTTEQWVSLLGCCVKTIWGGHQVRDLGPSACKLSILRVHLPAHWPSYVFRERLFAKDNSVGKAEETPWGARNVLFVYFLKTEGCPDGLGSGSGLWVAWRTAQTCHT